MKKSFLLIVLSITLCSCENSGGNDNASGSCSYNGHPLYVGEKGGCYYLSSGGNKEYVDKSYCRNCN